MKWFIKVAAGLLVMFSFVPGVGAAGGKIAVVAAENFYGDVAQQIGGDRVTVVSVLNNPEQDPHLFETSPSVIRQVAAARLVIYNGAAYDPWMDNLLKSSPQPSRTVIVAADLMHAKAGDNPHLWYDPSTMPAVAAAIAAAFGASDPAHKDEYAARLKSFLESLQPLHKKIAAIRSKYAGVAVTATEPVFNDMAAALKLSMHDTRFQVAVMNDTEPSAGDFAAFERGLQTHAVRLMFYNKQTSDRMAAHLIELARTSSIPVIGVTETCPPGLSFQQWMLSELDAVDKASAGPTS